MERDIAERLRIAMEARLDTVSTVTRRMVTRAVTTERGGGGSEIEAGLRGSVAVAWLTNRTRSGGISFYRENLTVQNWTARI